MVVSDDGNTVAVMNAPGPGHVRVYGYSQQSGEWTQVGNDILSNDANGQKDSSYGYDADWDYNLNSFPQAVSLSSDGSRLAIGYPFAGSGVGRARVFERQLNAWMQVGEDMIGGQGNSSAASWCDDYMHGGDCSWWYQDYMPFLGSSVSLSADGSRLAVGSIGTRYSTYVNNGYSGYTEYTTVRLVRVYQEPDSGLGQWSRLGSSLDAAAGGQMTYSRYGYRQFDFGAAVSLSDDGSTLAISGNKGKYASVHRFDSAQSKWLQVGNNITLNDYWYDGSGGMYWHSDPMGPSVALSGDSKRVIIGRDTNNYQGTGAGLVGVYEVDSRTGHGDPLSERYMALVSVALVILERLYLCLAMELD